MDEKVKVANMPVPVFENTFFYLNWKDLGTAMLVCQRWGGWAIGHPLLWTQFPLQPSGLRRLSSRGKGKVAPIPFSAKKLAQKNI